MNNRTIHAYGDKVLWSNLYDTSVGYGGEWCGALPHEELPVCDCKAPPFTLLPRLPFAHLKSIEYFQPIRIIQNQE
ncbi:19537_t:CDS:2 [Entrophospora sp. SA101]|nr:8946_t:CDS:2 [Entrophospora sp. SA101]CAJ0633267.1 5081_t:CDS:2 [Entrophospora sp. SA101]CAJ0747377.1 19537_t:CDS:2 [Entrophospora sp. SA101]CAJ0879500.1 8534_t:CDS:2 [Entrophospora sp. SA101]CAJ0901410.1 13275_t:CDS:2 [Entrophospora sp. SA101]